MTARLSALRAGRTLPQVSLFFKITALTTTLPRAPPLFLYAEILPVSIIVNLQIVSCYLRFSSGLGVYPESCY
jgi:hypothetical protein